MALGATASAAADPLHERLLRVMALELLLRTARASAGASNGPHPAMAGFVLIVQRDLHRPLWAAALAAEVGVSQNHLARLFRSAHGCTITA